MSVSVVAHQLYENFEEVSWPEEKVLNDPGIIVSHTKRKKKNAAKPLLRFWGHRVLEKCTKGPFDNTACDQ